MQDERSKSVETKIIEALTTIAPNRLTEHSVIELGSIARFGDLVTFVAKYAEEASVSELAGIE